MQSRIRVRIFRQLDTTWSFGWRSLSLHSYQGACKALSTACWHPRDLVTPRAHEHDDLACSSPRIQLVFQRRLMYC